MNGKNKLHQLTSQCGGQMMSYVIETADGKLIVIDGGYESEAAYLLNYMKELKGSDTVHVDAWLLTHKHSDHILALVQLINEDRSDLTIDKVYLRFPSTELVEKYENESLLTSQKFAAVEEKLRTMAEVIEFEEGMKLDIGTAHIDVLWVSDFSEPNNFINNASTVFRVTMNGTSVLFLGDLGVESGIDLLNKQGANLKSDYVEMAHHGQNGVDRPVYEAIAPKGCFWDTPKWLWENNAGKGWNSHIWKTVIVQGWMAQLGVKEHYITKDGTNTVEI